MIYTSYFSMLRNMPGNIQAYSIANGMPAGFGLIKLWPLVPSWGAVQQYKRSGDWENFKEQYLLKLENEELLGLLPLLEAGGIVLVCYEKDPSVCHRSILAEWLTKKYGLDVKEWAP